MTLSETVRSSNRSSPLSWLLFLCTERILLRRKPASQQMCWQTLYKSCNTQEIANSTWLRLALIRSGSVVGIITVKKKTKKCSSGYQCCIINPDNKPPFFVPPPTTIFPASMEMLNWQRPKSELDLFISTLSSLNEIPSGGARARKPRVKCCKIIHSEAAMDLWVWHTGVTSD